MIPHEKSAGEKFGDDSSTRLTTGRSEAFSDVVPGRVTSRHHLRPKGNIAGASCVVRDGGRTGFTLLELLVVVAIIVLVASFVLPAVGPILRGSQLNQATQMIVDQLSLARQTALAKNHSVEVRFYQFGDAAAGEQPANPNNGNFRAVQLFEITDSGPVPVGKVLRLPSTIIIDSSQPTDPTQALSTLIRPATAGAVPASTTAANQTTPIPGMTSYNSVAFRFQPDGSTNLSSPASPWFLTLHNLTDRGQLKANFATIQIDAFNGHLRTFRP